MSVMKLIKLIKTLKQYNQHGLLANIEGFCIEKFFSMEQYCELEEKMFDFWNNEKEIIEKYGNFLENINVEEFVIDDCIIYIYIKE